MLFIEFQRKICLKSGFPDRPLLSSEYRISERDKNESLIKSGKAELYLAFFFYFVSEIKLNKFFQIICGLTEPRPYPMPLQSVPETAAETAKISGYSDKSFRSGAGAAAVVSLIFGYVIAASHENMTDLRRRVFRFFRLRHPRSVTAVSGYFFIRVIKRSRVSPYRIQSEGFPIKFSTVIIKPSRLNVICAFVLNSQSGWLFPFQIGRASGSSRETMRSFICRSPAIFSRVCFLRMFRRRSIMTAFFFRFDEVLNAPTFS